MELRAVKKMLQEMARVLHSMFLLTVVDDCYLCRSITNDNYQIVRLVICTVVDSSHEVSPSVIVVIVIVIVN